MNFHFTLQDGEILTSIASSEDEVILFKIGEDLDTRNIFHVEASFTLIAGHPLSHREFCFAIVETDIHGDYIDEYKDGLQTLSFLIGDNRLRVLDAIRFSLEILAKSARPTVIVMVTGERDLPDKALVKYDIIFDALNSLGYHAARGNKQYGTHIWMAQIAEQ